MLSVANASKVSDHQYNPRYALVSPDFLARSFRVLDVTLLHPFVGLASEFSVSHNCKDPKYR
jgi:hypothetical protein